MKSIKERQAMIIAFFMGEVIKFADKLTPDEVQKAKNCLPNADDNVCKFYYVIKNKNIKNGL